MHEEKIKNQVIDVCTLQRLPLDLFLLQREMKNIIISKCLTQFENLY